MIELHINNVDVGAVNISWSELSSETIPNVGQESTLTITYGSNITVINTIKHHYSFSALEGAPSCEAYNLSIMATYIGATYSGPGCSVPSPTVSTMLPSLPDIEKLNSSLTYSLTSIGGIFILNITLEVL